MDPRPAYVHTPLHYAADVATPALPVQMNRVAAEVVTHTRVPQIARKARRVTQTAEMCSNHRCSFIQLREPPVAVTSGEQTRFPLVGRDSSVLRCVAP